MNNSVTQNFLFSRILVAVCTVMVLFVVPVVAQTGAWQKTNIGLANIKALAFNENTLLAVTGNNNMFRSEDNGTTWSPVEILPPSMSTAAIVSLIADGVQFYAGTSNGVFRSQDNGKTWSTHGQISQRRVSSLFATQNSLWAGTQNGLYEYTNDMAQWRGRIDMTNPIVSLTGFRNILIAESNNRLFRSVNTGTDWQSIPRPGSPTDTISSILVSAPNIIFVGTTNGNVYRSLDTGQTWSSSPLLSVNFKLKTNDTPYARPVAVMRSRGSTIFMGIGEALFISHNYGDTWSIFLPTTALRLFNLPSDPNNIFTQFITTVASPASLILNSYGRGNFFSINALQLANRGDDVYLHIGMEKQGYISVVDKCFNWRSATNVECKSWTKPLSDFGGTIDIVSLSGIKDTIALIAKDFDSMMSFDAGQSWVPVNQDTGQFQLSVLPSQVHISTNFLSSFARASANNRSFDNIFMTVKPFASIPDKRFDPIVLGSPYSRTLGIGLKGQSITSNKSWIFLSLFNEIRRIKDTASPEAVSTMFAGKAFISNTELRNTVPNQCYANNTTLLVGTQRDSVFRVTNIDQIPNTQLLPQRLNVQTFWGQNTTIFAGTTNAIYRSFDDGITWQPVGLQGLSVQAVWGNGFTILAGTPQGIFLSTDNGTSWQATNTGLANRNIRSLWGNLDTIFTGTAGGLFRLAVPRTLRTSLSSLTFPYVPFGTVSDVRGYAIAGAYLNGNVVIRAPRGFEIASSRTGGRWDTVLTRTPQEGTLSDSVFVRFSPKSTLSVSGFITHISNGTSATIPIRSVNPNDPARRIISTSSTTLAVVQPNPLHNDGTIRLRLSEKEWVRLTVTDALGKTLTTLVESVQNAGEYTLPLSVRAYANGRYYIVLQTLSEQQSYPLEVLK